MRPFLVLTALSLLCACSSDTPTPPPEDETPVAPEHLFDVPPSSQLDAELKPSSFLTGTGLPDSLKPPRR
ncbi:hypothetical protein [Stigmatella aurantiaca]|uniref:Lipoprotein n=1 Tax=Stigmatella aurantiaca (strain DW4/3-1) TaxID=378806 RepID=E3FIZ6_STIAD|nr:hypothetical protein [Stigmatella aurantiaca]ADO67896.1 uncharacterized protein STAUR_0087 [Stigmatella aurantiaca DW4/3-1]